MTNNVRELLIPPKATEAIEAYEIIRIWLTKAGPQLSLLAETWDDPAAWGILLVDVARHVANARAGGNGAEGAKVLRRIREGFDAEWQQFTSSASGGFFLFDK